MRVLAVVAALLVAGAAYVLAVPPAAPPSVATGPTAVPSDAPRSQPQEPKRRRSPRPTPQPSPIPSPTPRSVDPATAQLGAAEQRVAARLQGIIGRSKIRDNISLAVLDGQGQPVFAHQAATPVLPASTQKLAVAGGALARLGPGHRYTTTVTTTAQPDDRGVLRGDLILVGGGDPALAQPDFGAVEPDRPRTPLEDLVRQVKRAGIRRINGRILGNSSYLPYEPIAAGWRNRYLDGLDATRISGLTVDAGRRLYRANGALQADAANDPTRQAVKVFRRLLERRDIKVNGKIGVTSTTPPGATIATTTSPPLGALLRYMVQRSDNHLADTIFRSLGAADGDGTWVGAAAATAEVLAPLQLDWSGVVLADGSGLSRANRVSASFLAQLQARMMQSNLRDQWIPLLALSGESGTLRSRFLGTVAEERVYGKTGSLRDVSALVGTVAGTQGRHLHFAIVGNRLSSTYRMRVVTDRVVVAIAEELSDCRRIPRKIKREGAKPRPPRLVCG